LNSSVGKKYLMAITGLIWAGFVFAHMAGNLLLFLGPDAYNSYGHALTSGKIIFVVEAVLIFSFLSHVYCAISLTIENKKARGGNGYSVIAKGEKGASLASRTMAIHGSIILIFLISHILTFKLGANYETTVNGAPMRDLYRLIVEVFHQPLYLVWYIISLILLGFHLSHGVASMFQSFGVLSRSLKQNTKKWSITYAVIVALGFLSQPIYIFFFAN